MKQETNVKVDTQENEVLFEEQFKADLANAEEEFFRGEHNLKTHEMALKMMKDQLAAYKGVKDVIVNKCAPIEPQYEYETDETYLGFLKVAKELEVNQDIWKLEEQGIPSMEKTILAKIENLANLSDKIEKMRGDSNE